MITIELNSQQTDFLHDILMERMDARVVDETTKIIISQLITKLKSEE